MTTNSAENPDTLDLELMLESVDKSIAQLSIDCVIFGFHNNELKVLLSKFRGGDLWALQGGYVYQDEDIDRAAKRILEERTGLTDIYLEQFYTFGKADRPTYEFIKHILKDVSLDISGVPFFKKRFVSIGYYALVDFSKVAPKVDLFFEKSSWFDTQNLPPMAFDHAEIINKALETLRRSLDYKLVGFELMPETFTINELQKCYETILGEKLRRNNFQRKILEMDILERVEKKITGKAHKAPYLYRFRNFIYPFK